MGAVKATVSWKKDVSKWLDGRIQAEEAWDSVENWLLEPIFKPYLRKANSKGSHAYTLSIEGISQCIPKIVNDTFSISSTKGNKVKKWQIEVLVKVHEQLKTLEGD